MAFAEDMTPFFNTAEFARAAVWRGYSANVILDKPDEDVLGGRVSSTDYLATLPASGFPGITAKQLITIEGTEYSVREVKLLGDGAVKTLSLTKT